MVKEHKHDLGEGGFCICPKCGQRTEHRRGNPCQEERCPACNAKLLREGSYHHDLLMKKRAGRNSLD
jgi:NAD-dependent SIR2 family protein deacetylase